MLFLSRKIKGYIRFVILTLLLCMTLIFGQSIVVRAETVMPNLALATVSFIDSVDDNSYIYTGEQIEPKISLSIKAYSMTIPDKSYTYSIISTDGNGMSSGTNVGKVTIKITPVQNSICYGEKKETYYIQKANGLLAEDNHLILDKNTGVFDLSKITLNKNDCSILSYSLGALQDSNGVLSDISIDGNLLKYSSSGYKGIAKQEIIIETNNYEDVIATIYLEAPECLLGDVDNNGIFNITDVVIFQRWLLSVSNTHLENFKSADFCDDGKLNVFDLCIMKRALLKTSNIYSEDVIMNTNDEIIIIGSGAPYINNNVKLALKEYISNKCNNFNYNSVTFGLDKRRKIQKSANDNLDYIGDEYYFNLYYKGIMLNPEKYQINEKFYDDGTYTVTGNFVDDSFMERLNSIDLNPVLIEDNAVLIAKEYASGIDIPDVKESEKVFLEFGQFYPTEQFGKEISLIIYSVENSILAYKICDTDMNYNDVKSKDSSVSDFVVNIAIYVDAQTEQVIDHHFSIDSIVN